VGTVIRVNVKGIAYDMSGNPIILLTDQEEERVLPIWVGLLEAHSIAVALGQIAVPRPLTHDLFKSACEAIGARISQVVITDLKDSTFYAEVHLALPEHGLVLDARPSDAVALALRAAAPVYVTDKLTEHMLSVKDLFDEETRAELEKIFELAREYKKSLH
jgi:hypothetical protein